MKEVKKYIWGQVLVQTDRQVKIQSYRIVWEKLIKQIYEQVAELVLRHPNAQLQEELKRKK